MIKNIILIPCLKYSGSIKKGKVSTINFVGNQDEFIKSSPTAIEKAKFSCIQALKSSVPYKKAFLIDEKNNKIVQKILISGDSLNTEALIANKDNSNATLLFYHDKILCGKSSISSPFNFEDLQLLNSNAIHKITLINEQGQESSMSKDFNFKKINSEDLKDIYNSLFNKLFHSLPEEIKKDFKNKKINKTKAEKLVSIIKLHQDTKAGMQTINQFWADNASKYGLIYKSNMIFNEK